MVQELTTPVPTVILPAVSVPTIEGVVPQEETVGIVPVEFTCPIKVEEPTAKKGTNGVVEVPTLTLELNV